jgi:excisionase family DNA binding protein
MNSEKKLSDRFIGLRELAETLDVTTRTVYRMIQSGLIPKPVKVGHSVRFPVSDLEAYIERLKQSR